jgi:hypothetical protein
VFSSFIGAIPERQPTIEAILDKVFSSKRLRIITSSMSILEVVFASGHGSGRRLSSENESKIDDFWNSQHIEVVEAHRHLMFAARDLIREAKDQGWTLKSQDALHLATAVWIDRHAGNLVEVHTYDGEWSRYSTMLGGIKICEPYIDQLSLPFGAEE